MPVERKSLRLRRSATGARCLIAFFAIQVLVDLCHSVTALPFVHYGMFSERFPVPDSLVVFEITADGRRLDPRDFRIYSWDMVRQPLTAFDRQTGTHDFAFDKDKLRSGLHWAGLGGFWTALSPRLDNPPGLAARFPDWYKGYLGRILGHPVQSLRVDKAWYRYSGGQLILLKTEPWINR